MLSIWLSLAEQVTGSTRDFSSFCFMMNLLLVDKIFMCEINVQAAPFTVHMALLWVSNLTYFLIYCGVGKRWLPVGFCGILHPWMDSPNPVWFFFPLSFHLDFLVSSLEYISCHFETVSGFVFTCKMVRCSLTKNKFLSANVHEVQNFCTLFKSQCVHWSSFT